MATQDNGAIIAPSQNPVLSAINSITTTTTDFLKSGADIYSTFMNAKTAAKLATQQAQNGGIQTVPDQSILNPVAAAEADATAKTYFVYAALGLMVIGGAIAVFKMAK